MHFISLYPEGVLCGTIVNVTFSLGGSANASFVQDYSYTHSMPRRGSGVHVGISRLWNYTCPRFNGDLLYTCFT